MDCRRQVNPELNGWDGFVKALAPEWKLNRITDELMSLVADDTIATALWGCLKSDAIRWLYSEVPMLDNQRPIDLMTSSEGSQRVKRILLSSPWW